MSIAVQRIVFVVIAASSLAFTPVALACTPPDPGTVVPPSTDGTVADPFILAMLGATLLDGVLLSIDTGFGAEGRLLPESLAWIQLVVGLAHAVGTAGLGFAVLVQAGDSCSHGGRALVFAGAGLTVSAFGAWLVPHAIWSLAMPGHQRVEPTLAISDHGAIVGLTGSFD